MADSSLSKSSTQQHKEFAARQGAVTLALVTVSDSRNKETDQNGIYLREQIESSGHKVGEYRLIKDEAHEVEEVLEALSRGDAQVIIFNGGTGLSKRDRTFDVVNRKLEKILPGFGEIFRVLSYDQVGAAAMLSRAVAGVYREKIVIALPGSPNAVQLAWERLIRDELQHLAWEVGR